MDEKNKVPAAALITLLLTGCRRMEVLSLRWDEVNPPGIAFSYAIPNRAAVPADWVDKL